VPQLRWALKWVGIYLICNGITALLLVAIGLSLSFWRTHVTPPNDAYFEGFMNKKLSGYNAMDGRRLKCTSKKEFDGYKVDCQYFRDTSGEEFTYHWFDFDGSYISSLDGG
jgi:hypothetical protein